MPRQPATPAEGPAMPAVPALIVAHGQPSNPTSGEAALAALGRRVAGHGVALGLAPGPLATATLAAPGALAAGLAATGPGARIYPLFMAGGWFTRTHLPRCLAAAAPGAPPPPILPEFGADPGLPALAAEAVRAALAARGWAATDTALILAAHGARQGAGPARAAAAVFAARLRALLPPLRDLRLGFIEEAPHLADSALGAGCEALCLPLFAMAGGHVAHDIPAALARAGFAGAILPALGTLPDVPALIARALAQPAAGARAPM